MDITKLSQDLFDEFPLSDLVDHLNMITRDAIVHKEFDEHVRDHEKIRDTVFYSDRINMFLIKIHEELKK